MEIRNIRADAGFTAVGLALKPEENTDAAVRSSADRVEQSLRWVEQMEDQRAQLLALLNGGDREDKDSGGIFDYMETEEDELDVLAKQLKVQQKCQEIARRIMQGKKVPPQDEQYLMVNDPNGYKLAMALRKPPKKDEKECKSVLDDEDKQSGETSDSGEAAPVETGGAEAAESGGGEAAE